MISEILTTLSVLPLGPILASLGLAVLSIFITVKFYQGLTRIPPNLVKVLTPIFKSKKYLPLLLLALGIAALTKSFFILASVIVGCILVSTSVKTHAENSPTLLQIAFQRPASIYLSYPVFCIINFQIIFDPDADFAIADLIRNGGISLCMDMILWPAFIVLVQGLWIFLKQHTLHSSLVLFNVVFNLYYLPVHKTLYKNYPLFDTELAIIQFGLLLALMVTMIKTCSQLTLPQNRTTNLKIIQWSTIAAFTVLAIDLLYWTIVFWQADEITKYFAPQFMARPDLVAINGLFFFLWIIIAASVLFSQDALSTYSHLFSLTAQPIKALRQNFAKIQKAIPSLHLTPWLPGVDFVIQNKAKTILGKINGQEYPCTLIDGQNLLIQQKQLHASGTIILSEDEPPPPLHTFIQANAANIAFLKSWTSFITVYFFMIFIMMPLTLICFAMSFFDIRCAAFYYFLYKTGLMPGIIFVPFVVMGIISLLTYYPPPWHKKRAAKMAARFLASFHHSPQILAQQYGKKLLPHLINYLKKHNYDVLDARQFWEQKLDLALIKDQQLTIFKFAPDMVDQLLVQDLVKQKELHAAEQIMILAPRGLTPEAQAFIESKGKDFQILDIDKLLFPNKSPSTAKVRSPAA